MSRKGLESTIESLAQGLTPVQPLPTPLNRVVWWLGFALAYIMLVLFVVGVRDDLPLMLSTPDFLYEILMLGMIGVSAVCASSWLCIPDLQGKRWSIAVPLTLAASFSLWMALKGHADFAVMTGPHWNHCLLQCLLMAGLPAVLIMFMSNRGATTHPYLMAAMNVLGGAAVACIGLRISCASDSLDHLLAYHILPFMVVGSIVGLFARRIYKW